MAGCRGFELLGRQYPTIALLGCNCEAKTADQSAAGQESPILSLHDVAEHSHVTESFCGSVALHTKWDLF